MRHYITNWVTRFDPIENALVNTLAVPYQTMQRVEVVCNIPRSLGVPVTPFMVVRVRNFDADEMIKGNEVEIDTGFELIEAVPSNFLLPVNLDAPVSQGYKTSIIARTSPRELNLSGPINGRDVLRSVVRLIDPGFNI